MLEIDGVQFFNVCDKVWRGPRPPSMHWLARNGFQSVVDLQTGAHEALFDDLYENQNAGDFGILRFDYDLSNIRIPNALTVKHIALRIKAEAREGRKVYVHCRWGKDRTGYVIAAFRMLVNKWSFEAARAEMYSMGFRKVPYIYWVPSLRKFERGRP